MAQYCNEEKAAQVLGVTVDEVRKMREGGQLHGYRDGANWKFKADDLERVAQERRDIEEAEEVVLLNDVGGPGGPSSSGSVITMQDGSGLGSDVQIADMGSDVPKPAAAKPAAKPAPKAADSDLKLVGEDEEFSIDDSTTNAPKKPTPAKGPGSGAEANSALGGDEELVLGGSGGSGSDIKDSGIALIDPRDSGLALDEPLDLAGHDDESLQLGEDDLLAPKTDDEFLLTPARDGREEDDSESGSQVIALDEQPVGGDAATMVGTPSTAAMVAMLDGDVAPGTSGPLGAEAPSPDGPSFPLPAPAGPTAEEIAAAAAELALPETPYSIWSVLSLALCLIVLGLGGMMMFDLMRNMWSWETPYQVNSSLMDFLINLIEGK